MLMLHVYVAAVLLFTHQGYSQKLGESCVIKHTNTLGICAQATSCQSAKRFYQTNRITPTFCNRHLQNVTVCCSDESSILNTAPNNNNNNPVSSNNLQTTGNKKRLSEKKCEEYKVFKTVSFISLSKDPEPTSITIPQCDYNGEELILRGDTALTGEFPHMAAIGWTNFEGNYSFLCGGSLISSKFVLTAARCTKYSKMKDPNPVIVRLGDQNLDPTKDDFASPIEVPIKNITRHPLYKSPGRDHDIALLELASDFNFSEAIRPACLWNRPDFPEHTKALATGWGVADPRTMSTSDELQRTSLTLLENDFCDHQLLFHRNQRWGLTDNQLCAGDRRGNKDTCQGDSGSPLQVKARDNNCMFHLIGVKSFVKNSFRSDVRLSVYTRVSSYLDWIESVVWPGES